MDVAGQLGLNINFSTKALRFQSSKWQLPIHYKHGNAYIHHTKPNSQLATKSLDY